MQSLAQHQLRIDVPLVLVVSIYPDTLFWSYYCHVTRGKTFLQRRPRGTRGTLPAGIRISMPLQAYEKKTTRRDIERCNVVY